MGVLDDYNYNTGRTGGNGEGTTFSAKVQGVGLAVSNAANKLGQNISSVLDPSKIRAQLAGLLKIPPGGGSTMPYISWGDSTREMTGTAEADWRMKLSVSPGSQVLYADGSNQFLTPLQNTSGVIFPVTPQVQVSHTAKYSSQSLTHSNYGMHFYEGSEVASIMISGDFPVQTIEEGQYLLAAIYFFRAATKMFWGEDKWAGTPPPMLFLSGYGSHYFPNVPCVVTQFMHTLPDNVDYIDVPSPGGAPGSTRLPVMSQLQVTVQPIYSRARVSQFKLSDLASGNMIDRGFI